MDPAHSPGLPCITHHPAHSKGLQPSNLHPAAALWSQTLEVIMSTLKNPSATFSRWPTPYSRLSVHRNFLSIYVLDEPAKLVSSLLSAHTFPFPASASCLPLQSVKTTAVPKFYLASVDAVVFLSFTDVHDSSVSTSFPDWLLPFPATAIWAAASVSSTR